MTYRRFSVIIPTLYQSPEVLNNLLRLLDQAALVSEILVINNTMMDIALTCSPEKLRVITPEHNLYVNASWNRGVALAKEEALILMNDDIVIPENFIETVSKLPLEKYGLIGIHESSIQETDAMTSYITQNDALIETDKRTWGYGIVLLFEKKNFVPIPSELKIWCGDDFLFYTLLTKGLKLGALRTKIQTRMSTTAGLPEFDAIRKRDLELYNRFYRLK